MLIKDAEIVTVFEEVKSLKDFKANLHATGQQKMSQAAQMIEENKAVIKRQDKLIVDLHQKNQVCEYKILETQEEKNKQERAKNQLELRMQELEDKRKNMGEHISTMENRLSLYRDHLIQKEQEAIQKRKAQIEEQKRQALLEKQALKDNTRGNKSSLKRKTSVNAGRPADSKSVTSG